MGVFDGWRIAISTAVTAGLAVAMAAAFLYRSSTTPHVGLTSAALSDAFYELAGTCLGLAIGSFAAAMFVRRRRNPEAPTADGCADRI
jgi:fructose-specific phosphotransferase system IIC component